MTTSNWNWTFDPATACSVSDCGRFSIYLRDLMNRGMPAILTDRVTGITTEHVSAIKARKHAYRIAKESHP